MRVGSRVGQLGLTVKHAWFLFSVGFSDGFFLMVWSWID
jgi:hypothetical protein